MVGGGVEYVHPIFIRKTIEKVSRICTFFGGGSFEGLFREYQFSLDGEELYVLIARTFLNFQRQILESTK